MISQLALRGILILCLLAFVSGCVEKKRLPIVPLPPTEETVQGLLLQADAAWQARDYRQSRQLYDILVSELLTAGQLNTAWERLAISSLQTQDYARAQDALIRWALLDPKLRLEWFWHEYRVLALLGQGKEIQAEDYLRQILRQPESSWPLRSAAGIRLSEILRHRQDYLPLSSLFAELYAAAPEDQDRAELERVVARIARDIPDTSLQQLVGSVPPAEIAAFPNVVFTWEQRRREARMHPDAWQDSWLAMQRLLRQGQWADPQPFVEDLGALQEQFGTPGICVGLVLPLDGPLAETGWKVVRGAEAGRKVLEADGFPVRLEIVNSQATDLQEAISALAPECRVIGGPIQRDVWEQLQENSLLTSQRRFFTFLPTMGDAVAEGRQAWRFFGGPQDQVHALTDLAMNQLGIYNLAVLFPQDRFGAHMEGLFSQEVRRKGGYIGGMQSYPPEQHAEWGEAVAALLGVPAQQRRGRQERVVLPRPPFQAVFLPDSLSDAEVLLPQFFYYDEPRLLILGTELWSQSWLQRPRHTELQYFRLAAMPGAWWPDNPAPAARSLAEATQAQGLAPDFWVALGYDFARFAPRISQPQYTSTPDSLNIHLAGVTDFDWSMAPLSWNEKGQARQDLFLFQPTSQGLNRIEPTDLRNQLDRVRERYAR
ncbi:penicillin-binding protein activator [Desulfonatronum thioautotrophicum]|uniref:penicillin-binding protein activator n=1 Tax=Desulfonatronum thioautotrophicum TaxID=617001 RepID=UPI0005EB45AE|nr:penicillin-binding protein activator [Desulfonatronum thioautotrophicum]